MTDILACPFCGDDGDKGRQTVTMMNDERAQFNRIICRCCGAMAPELNWQKRAPATASEATAAQQDGWMSIETAPKDGTEMLLYAPVQTYQGKPTPERRTIGNWLIKEGGTVEHRDLDGRWIGQDESDGYEGWISWDGGFTEENPPTHWKPLPTPPASHGIAPEQGESHD